MKYMILLVFAVIGLLAWNSRKNIDPAEQACAREIAQRLRSDPDARPEVIADIFVKHGIVRSRCRNVSRMVIPQLRRLGVRQEDAQIVMMPVKAACSLVPDAKPGAG